MVRTCGGGPGCQCLDLGARAHVAVGVLLRAAIGGGGCGELEGGRVFGVSVTVTSSPGMTFRTVTVAEGFPD